MKITAYNHNEIEKDGKPVIPNREFSRIVEWAKSQPIQAYEFAINNYSLVPEQERLLKSIINPI